MLHEFKQNQPETFIVPKVTTVDHNTIACIEFICWKNVLRLFKIAANQTGLSSNFWWLRSAHYGKFTEKCDVYKEACFSEKKKFKNRAKSEFATTNLSQKDSLWNGNILTLG